LNQSTPTPYGVNPSQLPVSTSQFQINKKDPQASPFYRKPEEVKLEDVKIQPHFSPSKGKQSEVFTLLGTKSPKIYEVGFNANDVLSKETEKTDKDNKAQKENVGLLTKAEQGITKYSRK
jgi:hypothetical protein